LGLNIHVSQSVVRLCRVCGLKDKPGVKSRSFSKEKLPRRRRRLEEQSPAKQNRSRRPMNRALIMAIILA
jgi:ribosome-binding protein aMBF1 (putative translation factor)